MAEERRAAGQLIESISSPKAIGTALAILIPGITASVVALVYFITQ